MRAHVGQSRYVPAGPWAGGRAGSRAGWRLPACVRACVRGHSPTGEVGPGSERAGVRAGACGRASCVCVRAVVPGALPATGQGRAHVPPASPRPGPRAHPAELSLLARVARRATGRPVQAAAAPVFRAEGLALLLLPALQGQAESLLRRGRGARRDGGRRAVGRPARRRQRWCCQPRLARRGRAASVCRPGGAGSPAGPPCPLCPSYASRRRRIRRAAWQTRICCTRSALCLQPEPQAPQAPQPEPQAPRRRTSADTLRRADEAHPSPCVRGRPTVPDRRRPDAHARTPPQRPAAMARAPETRAAAQTNKQARRTTRKGRTAANTRTGERADGW